MSTEDKQPNEAGATPTSKRGRPVFFKFPFGWNELSKEEKERWASEAADALIEAAGGPEKAFSTKPS
jgi:hypothetical protein